MYLFSYFIYSLQIRRKMMKAIRKEKRILFKEKLYEKKFDMMKSGTYAAPVKVWNKRNDPTKDTSVKTDNLHSNVTGNKSAPSISIPSHSGDEVPKKNIESIEGLDLNYEMGPITDEHGTEEEEPSMDFNGIPYTVVETNLDRLNDQSDSDMETEVDNSCKSQKMGENKSSVKADKTVVSNYQTNSINKSRLRAQNWSKMKTGKKLLPASEENIALQDETVSSRKESQVIVKKVALKKKGKTGDMIFEENKIMTCIDGFWIKKKSVEEVERYVVCGYTLM